MKKQHREKPFFSHFLENQLDKTSSPHVQAGDPDTTSKLADTVHTKKYPSDNEDEQTKKYPSDSDEATTQKYPSDGDDDPVYVDL